MKRSDTRNYDTIGSRRRKDLFIKR